jgi:hypothetical protein
MRKVRTSMNIHGETPLSTSYRQSLFTIRAKGGFILKTVSMDCEKNKNI